MQEHIEDTRPPRPKDPPASLAPWGWYFGEFESNDPAVIRRKIYKSQ